MQIAIAFLVFCLISSCSSKVLSLYSLVVNVKGFIMNAKLDGYSPSHKKNGEMLFLTPQNSYFSKMFL